MIELPASLSGWTTGAVGVWALVLMFAGTLVRVWPVLKQRANEARKIELEGDGSLQDRLLKRVTELETRLATSDARCEEKLTQMRREFDAKYDGLMRQFITAQMAWAQAIPPSKRTPEIEGMLLQLKNVQEGEGS